MLKVRGLKKSYKTKKGNVFEALKSIDLDFPTSGFVFITGKSGSGKSTLLNILGGLDDFNEGEIIIKGKSSKDFKKSDFDSYRNTYLGFIFQDFNLLEKLSVAKNVEFALDLQSFKGNKKAKVKEILEKVELTEKRNNKISEISGGQKQRVAIARALVKDPEIIIADEPTGNLDSETSDAVMKMLRDLSKEKLVIMVTHDVDYAAEYADRVIDMKDGVVIKDETFKYHSVTPVMSVEANGDVKKVIRVPKSRRADMKIIDQINDVVAAQTDADTYAALTFDKTVVDQLLPQANELTSQTTIVEAVDLKYSDETNFKLIKSKLPFGEMFKMGFGNIWKRKFRLIFTVLLMAAALFFFGQSETLNRFAYEDAAAKLIEQEDTKYIEVVRTLNGSPFDLENFNKETYAVYKSKYNYETSMVYSTYNWGSSCSHETKEELVSICSVKDIVVTSDYTKFGYGQVLAGNVSNATGDKVIVTDILADSLIDFYGLAKGDYSALINGEYYTNRVFRVAAVVSSNYKVEFEKYQSLKNDIAKQNEWNLKKSRYITVMTKDENVISSIGYPIEANANSPFAITNKTTSTPLQHRLYNATSAPSAVKGATDGTTNITALAKGEIIVSDQLLSSGGVSIGDILTIDKNDYVVKASYDNSNKAYSYFYGNSLIVFNSEDITEMSFEWRRMSYNAGFTVLIMLPNDTKTIKTILKDLKNSTSYAMTTYGASPFVNQQLSNLYATAKAFGAMAPVFFVLSIVMLSLATFLIFNAIAGSVLRKKKEIGTLRAIGARGIDVAGIFIVESALLAILVSTLASVGVYLVTGLLNTELGKAFTDISVGLITVKPLVIIEVFAVGLGLASIAALMPVIKVASMKPIDAIKNR